MPHPRSQFLLDRLPHRRLDQRSLLAGVERATVFDLTQIKGISQQTQQGRFLEAAAPCGFLVGYDIAYWSIPRRPSSSTTAVEAPSNLGCGYAAL